MPRAQPILLAVLLLIAPAVARAQPAPPAPAQPAPPPPSPPAPQLNPVAREADQLFQEGREALKKGDLPRAADRFERSNEIDPSTGTLLNLAEVYEKLGQLVKALSYYEHAKKQLPDTDDRFPLARDGIARVKPRIPTLRIDIAAGSPPQLGIRIDGAPLAASSVGVEQPMDPGSYTVSTSAPGRDEKTYDVTLKESDKAAITVEAGAKMAVVAPGPAAPPPPAPRPLGALQIAGFAAGGVGLTGLVIGAVTGGLAIVKKGDAATFCPDPSRCTSAQGLTAAGNGEALAAVSTGAFVVGVAGAAAGVALVLVGREPKASPSAAVTPWVLPGGAGLGVHGRF